jgi:hypothetical protein
MADVQRQEDSQDEKVSVTLKLDAKVYESFLQKAQKAGVEIEPYLSGTLSIVLGCRVFNTTYACSPQLAAAAGAADCQKITA